MLILFFIYIIKRIRARIGDAKIIYNLNILIIIVIWIGPLLLSTAKINPTKREAVVYHVFKGNIKIGYVNVEKLTFNETSTYIINSEIKTRMIFKFNAIGRETYIYRKDILVHSSIFRKLNNKVKLNQSLSLLNGAYIFKGKRKEEVLNIEPIRINLVRLFFKEPVGIKKIYCDKYKTMLDLMVIGKSTYKLCFPDKSSCIYKYKNGKCISIIAVGVFYKVKLVPNI